MLKKQTKTLKAVKVGRDAPGYALRLTKTLHEEIKREADITGRSMNTVILMRLHHSYDGENAPTKVEDSARSYYTMSDTEKMIFAMIKKLPTDKQLALLSLLK